MRYVKQKGFIKKAWNINSRSLSICREVKSSKLSNSTIFPIRPWICTVDFQSGQSCLSRGVFLTIFAGKGCSHGGHQHAPFGYLPVSLENGIATAENTYHTKEGNIFVLANNYPSRARTSASTAEEPARMPEGRCELVLESK